MPAITAAVLGGVGTAVGLASAGMSFGQAAKQRKAQQEAQQAAEKAMEEAKKSLSVNYYKGLSIQKEPYELERQAAAQAGAQAIEAAKEEGRGLAPTAGRVQMAQNEAQAGIRTAMGQELSGLEKLTAEEESRLRDARAQINLEEAAGAQYAAGQAAKASQEAMAQGFQGLTNAATFAAGMSDKLYATKKTPTTASVQSQLPNSPLASNIGAQTPYGWNTQTLGVNIPGAMGNQQLGGPLMNKSTYVSPIQAPIINQPASYTPFNQPNYSFFGNNLSSVTSEPGVYDYRYMMPNR